MKDESISCVSSMMGDLEFHFGELLSQSYYDKKGKEAKDIRGEYEMFFFESSWRIFKNKKPLLSQKDHFYTVHYDFYGADYIKEIIDRELIGIKLLRLEQYNLNDHILYFTNDIVAETFHEQISFDGTLKDNEFYLTDRNGKEITDIENYCAFIDHRHESIANSNSIIIKEKKLCDIGELETYDICLSFTEKDYAGKSYDLTFYTCDWRFVQGNNILVGSRNCVEKVDGVFVGDEQDVKVQNLNNKLINQVHLLKIEKTIAGDYHLYFTNEIVLHIFFLVPEEDKAYSLMQGKKEIKNLAELCDYVEHDCSHLTDGYFGKWRCDCE